MQPYLCVCVCVRAQACVRDIPHFGFPLYFLPQQGKLLLSLAMSTHAVHFLTMNARLLIGSKGHLGEPKT